MTVITLLALALAVALGTAVPAKAQVSNCQAIAQAPGFITISTDTVEAEALPEPNADFAVEIRYVGHSTFRITAPDGTVIATDYAGYAGRGDVPDVVTMNHAHSSHYTDNPDPAIPHVLRGWGTGEAPAEHLLSVGNVLVRNVPTDIRRYSGTEEGGNSIFIFEIEGLCIGHLGHLHQPLSDAQVAQIGRLDIVFVPIDGTYTMNHAAMMTVVERLRASLVIPMHYFSTYTLEEFAARTRDAGLNVRVSPQTALRVSLNTLPSSPTLLVLPRDVSF